MKILLDIVGRLQNHKIIIIGILLYNKDDINAMHVFKVG